MNKRIMLWMLALLLLAGSALAEITSIEQLNQAGITVGAELGSSAEVPILPASSGCTFRYIS